MQRIELEMEVGEAIQIGDRIFTLIDTHGDGISFRLDSEDGLPVLEEEMLELELVGA